MIEVTTVDIEKRVAAIIAEIQQYASFYNQVVVAFSGGMDSTVALFLSLLAVGREKVQACTVDWEDYFPRRARENIDFLISHFHASHVYLPGKKVIEEVVRRGPACNLCTKKAKLGTIKKYFGDDALIIGGANQSDSWGIRGLKYVRNTYSPLFDFTKEEIFEIIQEMNIPIRRIGENRTREGCVLKHLYKPLASEFHARAVIRANALLLDSLHRDGFEAEIANVKIIGTLQTNTALINCRPLPDPLLRDSLTNLMATVKEIDSVYWIDRPVSLVVRANPGLYRNQESRYWIETGKLQPDFVQPITVRWMPSTNRRLRTFQVVDFWI